MILRSVELESFGKFRGEQFELRRGMNLVIGPNEAGKSTLAEAIPAVLFGSDRLERYKPWGRNTCAAALVFEGQGRTIQIRRNLLSDEVQLIERDDMYHVLSQFSGKVPLRGRSATCREYLDLLETLLGVSDEGLFRATYFFGHHPQEWLGDELAKKLRSLVSGSAESDYAQILDALLDEHFQLTRDNPWGRDKQRDREYEEVCQRLAACGAESGVPVFVELDSAGDVSEQIEVLTRELDNDRSEYAKGERYIAQVRSRVAALQLAAVVDTAPVVDEAPAAKPAAPAPPGTSGEALVAAGLPADPPRALPEILSQAAAIRQELAELQRPYSDLKGREGRIPTMPWGLLTGGAVLVAAAAGVAWWRGAPPLWSALGAVLGLAGLAAWGFLRRRRLGSLKEACDKERRRLDQMKFAAQTHQAELAERCEALGLPSSAIDLVRLQKLVTAHQPLLDAYWSGTAPPAVEGAAPPLTPLTPPVKPAAAAATEASPPPAGPSSDELRQLEARLQEFAAQMRLKEERLASLKRQQDSSAAQLGTADVRPTLVRRKHELEDRIAVLRKAVDLLAAAVDAYSGSHLLRLNEEVSRLFGKLTGGRHPAVQLDDNMAPMIQVDGRRWQPVEHFSRGTVDALYLALRIALAKVRGDGRSLPLMLDDPFVHLDQRRLTTALNLVDLASTDGQLILLSHNLELGKRAARERWHVVPLDDDSVNPSTGEGGEHAGQLHLL